MSATLASTCLFILQSGALADLGCNGKFWVHVVEADFLSAIVKELLKSDSICQSYAQMKNGPVFFFLTHSVERESRRAYIEYHFQVDLSRVQGTA